MGALSSIFSFGFKSQKELGESELENIYPLSLAQDSFIKSDILSTFLKILTDTMERTHGLPEKFVPVLWDNCLQNESSLGLISLLADAMTNKSDLFLVYVPSVKILRKATSQEETQIRDDFKKNGESKVGVYISFKKYRRTEMLEIYSIFEYCILASLNKSLNLSKAIQVKIFGMRSSVSLADSGVAVEQAKSIAKALKNGNDVMIDKEDTIETAVPDTSSIEKGILFLNGKRADILGLPIAYIAGEQTGGMGSSGENDMRAVERGLKQYFVSIIKPTLKALFGAEVEFKSQDFRQMTTALEVLKTFELTSNENMSKESKQEVVARVFDLDPDKEKKQIEKENKEEGETDDEVNDDDNQNEDDSETEEEGDR